MKAVGEKLISIVVHDLKKTAEQYKKYKRSDSINNHKHH